MGSQETKMETEDQKIGQMLPSSGSPPLQKLPDAPVAVAVFFFKQIYHYA